MEFIFECPHCAQYNVNPDTLKAAITPDLQTKLTDRIDTSTVSKAILRFESDCPRCKPNSEYKVSLEIEPISDSC